MVTRRPAGSIRRLPSGRFQARYYMHGRRYNVHPSGGRTGTFANKTHAKTALDKVLAEISPGKWTDPDLGSDLFAEYAADWLEMRELKPRTAEHYRKLLEQHILQTFGDRRVDEITVDAVNRWYGHLGNTTGPTMRAHAYSLLKSILRAAVDGRKIEHNPCTIRGGGSAKTAKEVTVAKPAQVDQIAAAVPERFALHGAPRRLGRAPVR
jgi:hypothetical protein